MSLVQRISQLSPSPEETALILALFEFNQERLRFPRDEINAHLKKRIYTNPSQLPIILYYTTFRTICKNNDERVEQAILWTPPTLEDYMNGYVVGGDALFKSPNYHPTLRQFYGLIEFISDHFKETPVLFFQDHADN